MNALREFLAARAYMAGWAMVRTIPQPIAAWIFDRIADVASGGGQGPEQLRKNLSRVVGPENVTRELVRDSMRSYMRYWQEAFRLPALHKSASLLEALEAGAHGFEHFEASHAKGKGVVIALTHSGNWDMAGTYLVAKYGQFTTVAERLRPEALFDAFVRFRQELGFEVLAHRGGQRSPFHRLKEVLESGGVVCLVAERDLGRTGVEVNFFGEKANMAAGPAMLALETGAALHVAHSSFSATGWNLEVSPELEVSTVAETTQRMADIFAHNIARHPQDWHMLQPLWNEDFRQRSGKTDQGKTGEGA